MRRRVRRMQFCDTADYKSALLRTLSPASDLERGVWSFSDNAIISIQSVASRWRRRQRATRGGGPAGGFCANGRERLAASEPFRGKRGGEVESTWPAGFVFVFGRQTREDFRAG